MGAIGIMGETAPLKSRSFRTLNHTHESNKQNFESSHLGSPPANNDQSPFVYIII